MIHNKIIEQSYIGVIQSEEQLLISNVGQQI